MRIYLIRHGRQNSSLCNVDVPLSTAGEEQAHLLGRRLTEYNIDAVYASDLIRAKETAAIIRDEIVNTVVDSPLKERNIVVRKEIREIDFGKLEGMSDSDIRVTYKEFLDERDRLEEDLAFPGGECGQDVINRMSQFFMELKKESYENIVVVTHGGAIRSILTKFLNMNPADKLLFSLSLENTSITELLYVKEKDRYYVERLNDYAHLEERPELLRRNWVGK